MTVKKHAVKVMIGGDEYTVRSDLPPEYTREVAGYVDQALKRVLSQGAIVETHKAAILAALADDLAKMLPPGKRKTVGL